MTDESTGPWRLPDGDRIVNPVPQSGSTPGFGGFEATTVPI